MKANEALTSRDAGALEQHSHAFDGVNILFLTSRILSLTPTGKSQHAYRMLGLPELA